MNTQHLKNISAALFSYSAADFNKDLLHHITIDDLISIILVSNDHKAEFRAAWAVEHLLLQNKNLLIEYKLAVVQIYLSTTNWSVLRSISKIVMILLKNPFIHIFYVDDDLRGHLLDKTFKFLADNDCPIAVRCNAYDIIYYLGENEDWVLSELKTQIYFDLERKSTPALASRGAKLLKKLKRVS